MSRMKFKLKRIDPVKAGLVYGLLLALLGFVIVLISVLFSSAFGGATNAFGIGVLGLIFAPIIYGVIGFIFGLIGTALLNFVLSKTDGLEVEFDGDDSELSKIGKDSI